MKKKNLVKDLRDYLVENYGNVSIDLKFDQFKKGDAEGYFLDGYPDDILEAITSEYRVEDEYGEKNIQMILK